MVDKNTLETAVKVESQDSAFAVENFRFKKHTSLNSSNLKNSVLKNKGERVVMVNPSDDLTPTDLLKRFGVVNRDQSMFPNRADGPTFGDFSSFKDFSERAGLYTECQNQFYGLASEIRDKFDNDLGKFATFVNQDDFDIEYLMTEDFKKNIYYPHLNRINNNKLVKEDEGNNFEK